jgi:hypothetical protein
MIKHAFDLADDELDEISGGAPNLGGYTACPDGLYVGPCPKTLGDYINEFVDAARKGTRG